jgi:uncharacterized membrane protein
MENKEMAMDDVAAARFLNPAREVLARFGKMKINVAEAERWGSAAMGGGLMLYGLKRRSWTGLLLALAGGGLMLRGIMGRSVFYRMIGINTATGHGLPGQDLSNGLIRVDKSLAIARSPEDMFRFLRAVENLPRFFGHLRSVRVVDGHRSVWTAKMPAGLELEWEAEIWEERENRKIAWRASGEAGLRSEGSLILDPLGDGTRTQVGVHLEYDLPAGKVGRVFAKLFGKHPDRLIDEELHRLKSLMETGA